MHNDVFHRITYGLYVVSSANGSQSNGYVANTVFQVTAKPARFAIACNKDNYTCGLISQSQAFSISILQQETKPELIGLFGYRSGRTLNKYASVHHQTGQTGAPILLEDTVGWLECRVVQTVDVGTHLLFVGEVVDGDITDSSQPPLTYAYYRDVKKGKAPKNAPTYLAPARMEVASKAPSPSGKYACATCGHVYDPAVGDPDAGIPAGTRFEDLPENWVCPVCGAAKSDFVKQP
jgi:flavin reductase (DIM6/NTAB) family NADH-FMN oxidoreductase RutF/rubredoxin